ncbi:GNAT family N-acetyltransferase [Aureispira anguillae]|uniref:GNAT family N-acetyltransferase n=1 Tax=Aureispira anguillae TaxID=2864201 RepID=A0A916DRT6_9BACT|nr:GNAT family N-acetyltransferase [Aureispira anguillae]BDS10617.1 GNAT family N-acetyltransferase [Aureispira anguillae]
MLNIQPYSSEYKEQCLVVFKSNIPQYFLLEELKEFSDWLDQKASDGRYYIALQQDVVVACGGYFCDKNRNKLGLSWGMVHVNLQGTGIGTRLTQYRIQKMMAEFPNETYMIDTSQHTFGFYQKLGFVTKEITPNGFGEGMDKYYMEFVHHNG